MISLRRAQRTSSKGKDFLAREEGIRLYAYNDSAGNATFGVGHLLHRGSVTAADRHQWGTIARPHTRRFAMKIFGEDLKHYEAAVRQAVGRRLPQQQFDACVSLCFNIGTAGFAGSSVAHHLRSSPVSTRARLAANAILLWDHPAELLPRRKRERALFLS